MRRCLCVEKKAIEVSGKIQKNINLTDILLNHTEYFDDNSAEVCSGEYVPLSVCISVRSLYTNKAIKRVTRKGLTRYYVNITELAPVKHKGYDWLMYYASIAFSRMVNINSELNNIMAKYSQFQPIGLYNPDPNVLNPMIYCHIIIKDDGIYDLEKLLKSEYSLVDIEEVKKLPYDNIQELVDSFIILKNKEEESNE